MNFAVFPPPKQVAFNKTQIVDLDNLCFVLDNAPM